ncbi:MAG TPA: MBL fold metallo-hydrolase [Solirubrobacteraceae bacterium]|nr:MBL fold metallo-hydrolase [Solirubrobacteraceae bacterium]
MNAPLPPDPGDEIVSESESESGSDADLLKHYDVLRLRAPNPGPFTLSGTNTWIVGRRPAWVVDPGPLIETHLERLLAAVESRGGLGGVALTHDHEDHAEAVGELLARYPAPLAGGRGGVDVELAEGVRFGPFDPVATSGHSSDHFALIADGACFTGDAVLGEGSVYIAPHRGAMSNYLLALTRLRLREDFNVICPGHGPTVWDAEGKLEEYVNHRLDREHALIYALGQGLRSERELLDAVWPDVSEAMRPLASVTLAAHLDKLYDEQILPEDVERPTFESFDW